MKKKAIELKDFLENTLKSIEEINIENNTKTSLKELRMMLNIKIGYIEMYLSNYEKGFFNEDYLKKLIEEL